MTQEEFNKLESIAYDKDKAFIARPRLQQFLRTVVVTKNDQPKGGYTGNQRNAAWLYMTQKAEQLNQAGLDMRVILKPTYHISWTKENFHDHVWIPLQKALFGTESMTKLTKDQPGRIHELIEREINEKHGTEYVPFPHFNMKLTAVENAHMEDYPEHSKTAFE